MIKLEVFQYNVLSADKRREGDYIGTIYRDGDAYHFGPEVDELLSTELRALADTLDKLNGENK
jgi:hypothetical protein